MNESSKQTDTLLFKLAAFISSEKQDSLEDITLFISELFDVDYVHIALLEPDCNSVRVVAGILDGKNIAKGYVYNLLHTPCENVVGHDHRCYSDHVQELFPEDHDLQELSAEAYIGEPIDSSEGKAIGLIALVSRTPLQTSQTIVAVLQILLSYITKILSINENKLQHQRYKHIMHSASDGIIIYNTDHSITEFNRKAKEMLGYNDEEMLNLKISDIDVNYSKESIEQILEQVTNAPINFETVHKRKDGSLYEAAVTANLLELDGKLYFYSSARDITTQKELQGALADNKRLLESVIDEMPDVLVVKDENAKFILANQNVASLYKTTPEAMVGKDDGDFGVPKEMANFFRENVLSIMKKGETEIIYEDTRDASTGEIRHYKSIKKPFKTLEGKNRILVIAQDITELVTSREALEIQRNKLQNILQTTRDAFWLVDKEGKLADLNPSMSDMYGYTREEAIGINIIDIEVNESTEDIHKKMKYIQELGSASFETKHRRKDGSSFDVEVSITFIPEQSNYVVFTRDISERIEHEKELSHQRGFLRTLINTIPDLIWLKDSRGVYLACNTRFEEFFGAKEMVIVGKTDYDFVDKELADFFRKHDNSAMHKGKPTVNEEEISFASDGHKELLQTTKMPMYDDQKHLIGILGIGHDITKQHAIENRLVSSEQSFRSLFDSLQEAVYVEDVKGTFLAVNEGAARMYKRDKEWFVGKSPFDVSAPGKNNLEELKPLLAKVLAGEPQSFEFWGIRSDGTHFPKEVHQTKGTWFGQEVVFAVAIDITERKKHQAQLEHMAHYDALTGLPNRVLFSDCLEQAISHANRHDSKLAVLYLDLDGFKEVNDTYGHDVGDHMLVSTAHRIKEVLRAEDTLARIGGDEFVAVMVDLKETDTCIPILDRILEVVQTPVSFKSQVLKVSVSIGVTFYSKSSMLDASQLIRQSDQAMYNAKQSGRNCYSISKSIYLK